MIGQGTSWKRLSQLLFYFIYFGFIAQILLKQNVRAELKFFMFNVDKNNQF